MTSEENLELARLFLLDEGRGQIYGKVRDFIATLRGNDRSRILSVVKPLMGGDLEQDSARSKSVLAHQEQVAAVEGHHSNGSRMLHDIPLVSAAVRVLDGVHAKRDVRPAVDDARLDQGLMEVVITHRRSIPGRRW